MIIWLFEVRAWNKEREVFEEEDTRQKLCMYLCSYATGHQGEQQQQKQQQQQQQQQHQQQQQQHQQQQLIIFDILSLLEQKKGL